MLARQARRRWHSWWWIFGALIALPAAILAALGASAIRATESERQVRLREQQQQVVRLADAALATALDRVLTDARARSQGAAPVSPDPHAALGTYFELSARGSVSFPADRIYVDPVGSRSEDERGLALTPEVRDLVAEARSAEAQGRMDRAADLYGRLRSFAELRKWAETQTLLLQRDAGPEQILAHITAPTLASSDARAPSGIPLAIVVSSMNEGLALPSRRHFVPLLRATLENLRGGRWWMRLEQRHVYDAELRRWLRELTSDQPGEDAQLDLLAHLAEALTSTLAPAGDLRVVRARVVEHGSIPTFVVWDRPSRVAPHWSGVAMSQTAAASLFDDALQPVVAGQPFALALHDERTVLWGAPADSAAADRSPVQKFTLTAVPQWTLTLASSGRPSGRLTRLLDRAIVVVPLFVLACGLVMTIWIARREGALSQMQASFLAAVTHEFKSPITGIRILVERIQGGRVEDRDALARYHTAVAAELARLEGLVNRLLDAQALQSGRKQYRRSPTDMASVIDEVVTRVRPQADAKRITLTFTPAASLPALNVDAPAVADAIRNLLDNAIKYSDEGTTVHVTLAADSDQLAITVADEGIGVAPAETSRIFDAFYRGRRGEDANVHGTGLGLALVKATAEAHGGTVRVTSDGV